VRFTADTNVFIYLTDGDDIDRRDAARILVARLRDRDTLIGLQVVGEVQNVLRRKYARPVRDACDFALTLLSNFPDFSYEQTDVRVALEASRAGAMQYWDALLVSAAGRAGCNFIFTEDMHDGTIFEGVEIVKPFDKSGVLTERAREILEF